MTTEELPVLINSRKEHYIPTGIVDEGGADITAKIECFDKDAKPTDAERRATIESNWDAVYRSSGKDQPKSSDIEDFAYSAIDTLGQEEGQHAREAAKSIEWRLLAMQRKELLDEIGELGIDGLPKIEEMSATNCPWREVMVAAKDKIRGRSTNRVAMAMSILALRKKIDEYVGDGEESGLDKAWLERKIANKAVDHLNNLPENPDKKVKFGDIFPAIMTDKNGQSVGVNEYLQGLDTGLRELAEKYGGFSEEDIPDFYDVADGGENPPRLLATNPTGESSNDGTGSTDTIPEPLVDADPDLATQGGDPDFLPDLDFNDEEESADLPAELRGPGDKPKIVDRAISLLDKNAQRLDQLVESAKQKREQALLWVREARDKIKKGADTVVKGTLERVVPGKFSKKNFALAAGALVFGAGVYFGAGMLDSSKQAIPSDRTGPTFDLNSQARQVLAAEQGLDTTALPAIIPTETSNVQTPPVQDQEPVNDYSDLVSKLQDRGFTVTQENGRVFWTPGDSRESLDTGTWSGILLAMGYAQKDLWLSGGDLITEHNLRGPLAPGQRVEIPQDLLNEVPTPAEQQ